MDNICVECEYDPKAYEAGRISPLGRAVRSDHVICANVLIARGHNPNVPRVTYEWNYLQLAAVNVSFEMLDLLYKSGMKNDAYWFQFDGESDSPFHLLWCGMGRLTRNRKQCAKLLLDNGCDTLCCGRHKVIANIWALCSARQIPRVSRRACVKKLPAELFRLVYNVIRG
jgi:hypothetical protein